MKKCNYVSCKNLADIEANIRKIGDNLNILEDYCQYNLDNTKICPILSMIEQLRFSIRNIEKHF